MSVSKGSAQEDGLTKKQLIGELKNPQFFNS
jgi:hypothetical protein